MRRQRRLSRQGLTLDLTPMVDVVFLLVIFFMVSTTFITLETGLPVDLPQAQMSQAQVSEIPTVTVTREGQIYLSGTQVAEEDLEAALADALAASPTRNAILRADQEVMHGLAVRVMDSMRQAGAERISIATGGN